MGTSLVTGIDIGHSSIKAVVLKPVGESYALVTYKELPVSEGIFADNHTVDHQEIVKKLKELKKSIPMFQRNVALAIPDSVVISKVLQIDADLEDREKEFAIYQAFAHQSPFPIEELNLDFVKIDEKVTTRASTATYQVYASKKTVIDSRVDAVKKAGLTPLIMDVQAHGLLRVWENMVDKFPDHKSWLLVDIGYTQTAVCSSNGQSPFFKDLALGTKQCFASEVSSETDPKLTEQFTQDFVERIKRIIQMQGSMSGQGIQGIWLSGGGATTPNLAEEVVRKLNIECEVLNPFLSFTTRKSKTLRNAPHCHRFSTAAGLAISGIKWMEDEHVA